jgi:multiple sugar transport system ATP-binding protein
MAGLTFKNIQKIYPGGVVAVDHFNLEVPDKEFLILVGPSGCGKTTTLRMIAGLEEITEGELFIDSVMVNDIAPKDRDIAMVFQNYALYPHMSVFDNMAFGLKLRKTPKPEIKKRVHEAAKILDIEHLLDRSIKALSGGQRQRVALGRAIVREPKVFLMDEPLSNLDAKLRVQMRTEISKLHQKLQTTIVYVTHDQIEAMTMGTRIVVMKDGLIQQVASPQGLYNKPNNKFVAGFIGTPPMNFIDAYVVKNSRGVCAKFAEHEIPLPEEKASLVIQGKYIGKDVTLGLRPESISADPAMLAKFPDSTVEGKVEVVEMLGSETLLYMVIEGANFIAKVAPGTVAKPGDLIKVAFDPNSMHMFDRETEVTIHN